VIVAVDPGKSHYAWALLRLDGVLHACHKQRFEDLERARMGFRNHILCAVPIGKIKIQIAVESQQIDDRTCPGRDLIPLAQAAGAIASAWPGAEMITPAQWTGGKKKASRHEALKKTLTEDELALLPKTKGELKDVLDAVGLAKWYYRRMKALEVARGYLGS